MAKDQEATVTFSRTQRYRRERLITLSCREKDRELIDWIAQYLGTSRSEAIRTATRHFAAHIGYLERGRNEVQS